jgi:hypothetical protein
LHKRFRYHHHDANYNININTLNGLNGGMGKTES